MAVDKLSRANTLPDGEKIADWLNALGNALAGNMGAGEDRKAPAAKPLVLSANDADWRDRAGAALDGTSSTRTAIIEMQNPHADWDDGEKLNPWPALFPDFEGATREQAVKEANRPLAAVEQILTRLEFRKGVDGFSFTPDGLVFYKDGKEVGGPDLSADEELIFKWIANNEALTSDLAGSDGIVMTSELRPWLDARTEGLEKAGSEFEAWLEKNPGASREQRAEKRLELIEAVDPSLLPFGAVGPGLDPDAPEPVNPAVEAYLEKNPDADPMAKDIVGNAGLVLNYWDQISGGKKEMTADDVAAYLEAHPELSQEVKDALALWSQPGIWAQLDTGGDHPALGKADGIVTRKNVETWISTSAPVNATQFTGMLNNAALQGAARKVDISGIGPDIFVNPNNYTHEQRTAVLVELLNARTAIESGIQSGMWGDAKSQVWVSANANVNPNSDKLLADLNDKIDTLTGSDGMQDHLRGTIDSALKSIVDADPGLKAAVQRHFEEKIASGAGFEDLVNLKDSKGASIGLPAALGTFIGEAETMAAALGLDAPDMRAILSASGHLPEIEQYFRDRVVSGADLQDMIARGIDPTLAFAAFGEEIAHFKQVLEPALFESLQGDLEVNFGKISYDALMGEVTFDDLKVAYGNADGTLDEAKMREILTQLAETNPELFAGPNGTFTVDQILSGVRAVWDDVRQGAKVADAFAKLDFLVKPDNSVQKGYAAGAFHLFSGLMMAGVTIARGANIAGGTPSTQNIVSIVTGATITSGVLLEGGAKAYNDWLVNVAENLKSTGKMTEAKFAEWKTTRTTWSGRVEVAGKLLGGPSGMVAGVFGIISGTSELKKGNTAMGAINLTGGSLAILAGGATTAEALLTILGAPARVIASAAALAGIAGGAAAVFGIGWLVGVQIWQEVKTENALSKFAGTIDDYLDQWGIDGGPTQEADYTHVSEGESS